MLKFNHFELDDFKFISHNYYYSSQEDLKQISMNLHPTLTSCKGAKIVQVLSNWKSKICQDDCILGKPCILIFKFTMIWIISFFFSLTHCYFSLKNWVVTYFHNSKFPLPNGVLCHVGWIWPSGSFTDWRTIDRQNHIS